MSSSFPFRGLRLGEPALILAPMEGVTDYPMRALLSSLGGFAFCVSEFLRVSHEVPPAKVFLRHVPELKHGSRTSSGVPVQVQLLGGDPGRLAESARVAVELGAWGIDLNFGCPAPTVNRHDGGATLLKYPSRIYDIVRAVRDAVPAHLPVSAKLRLGWDTVDAIYENADRAVQAGASWITIHGRTRVQGYAPPALWTPIGEVKRRVSVPVVANGDLWTIEDIRRCREETGCEHFMLGRGAMAAPYLPKLAAQELLKGKEESLPSAYAPAEWAALLHRFGEISTDFGAPNHDYVLRRMKQWLSMARHGKSIDWFDAIKRCESPEGLVATIRGIAGGGSHEGFRHA
jgi:tRNA-dihydrouridine synthase C